MQKTSDIMMNEHKELALDMFIKASKKFIAKVENGDARSTETYNDLKKALYEAEKGTAKNHLNTCDLVGFRQGYNAPARCSCGAEK